MTTESRNALVEQLARAISDADRAMSDLPPMTDEEWLRLNPWDMESLTTEARAILPIIAAERAAVWEAAAAVAEGDYAPAYGDSYLDGQNTAGKRIAAAIRAKGAEND